MAAGRGESPEPYVLALIFSPLSSDEEPDYLDLVSAAGASVLPVLINWRRLLKKVAIAIQASVRRLQLPQLLRDLRILVDRARGTAGFDRTREADTSANEARSSITRL